MKKVNAIILIGSPGSGKTSIAQRFADHDQFEIYETGRMLRDEIESESGLGKKLEPYLKSGRLAPTKLVLKVMHKQIKHLDSGNAIFDGSPRRMEETTPFLELLKENYMDLLKVILFQTDERVAAKRLISRRICINCGHIFNIYYNPPVVNGLCDRCGALLDRRDDDNEKAIEKRLNQFEKYTKPVIKFLEREYPDKIFTIRTENPLDLVYKEVWTEVNREELMRKADLKSNKKIAGWG
jgi:adenylate kinase